MTINANAGINLIGNTAEIDISTQGLLDINPSLEIDSTTSVSIDAAADSNLTVTGEGKDLDIAVAGGGTQTN